MRFVLFLLVAVTQAAEEPPKATWTVDGTTYKVAKKDLKDGVKVVLGFLESCSAETVPATGLAYTKDDLKKAQAGDHFHLVFGKAQTVRVMNNSVELTELVVSSGAIWVRSGDKIRRFTKYEFKNSQAFEAWLRRAAKVIAPTVT